MEHSFRQSISCRGLTHSGFDELGRKALSTATLYGVPIDFSVDNLYLMHTFSSCARTRFKWCLNAAMGDGSPTRSRNAPSTQCPRSVLT